MELPHAPVLGERHRDRNMNKRDIYAEAFMLAWEHIQELSAFSDNEKASGYEPLKAKVYELMEAGELDPLYVATEALSWFRDQTQIKQSANRLSSRHIS